MVLDILGANAAGERMVPRGGTFVCVQEMLVAKETFERVWREWRFPGDAELEFDVGLLRVGYGEAAGEEERERERVKETRGLRLEVGSGERLC